MSRIRYCSLLLWSILLWNHIGANAGFTADEQVVFELSANGSRNTRPFIVKDRWELRWKLNGEIIGIMIKHADGKYFATGGEQNKPGEGSSFQPKGGTFYLDITGMGDWTVTVVQLP